jgi:signal peptidase I
LIGKTIHSPMHRLAVDRPSRIRRLIEGTVLTLAGLVLVSTWHARSFVVSGPSMAETLVGVHRQFVCADCGCTFLCGADEPEMLGKRAVCPNCGEATGRLDTVPRLSADGVLVDRSAFLFRPPHRWELTAFRGAERGSQVYVKRVVGLPGETIELRHGDVYADGVIQRKDFAQQRAMAVVVYDSTHESPQVPSRWLPDAADSSWRHAGARFWRPGTTSSSHDEAIDWLAYHHRRPASDIADECPITDDCGYNQTSPVTESHLVRDLLVRCQMRIADSPSVTWLLTDGLAQFLVELDFASGQAAAVQDGQRLGVARWPRSAADTVVCELALCDQQVLLALDGREVLRFSYTPPDVPLRPTSRPVAVGTRGDGLELWDVVLLRDVYYRPDTLSSQRTAQDRLGNSEYFVLGDNSSVSLDSRNWPQPGVAADNLIGKPLLAYPSGVIGAGPDRHFQVPALGRFRYIH